MKFANPKGLSLQDYEREVDKILTGNPRVNQKVSYVPMVSLSFLSVFILDFTIDSSYFRSWMCIG